MQEQGTRLGQLRSKVVQRFVDIVRHNLPTCTPNHMLEIESRTVDAAPAGDCNCTYLVHSMEALGQHREIVGEEDVVVFL